jgi:hypothetical protein
LRISSLTSVFVGCGAVLAAGCGGGSGAQGGGGAGGGGIGGVAGHGVAGAGGSVAGAAGGLAGTAGGVAGAGGRGGGAAGSAGAGLGGSAGGGLAGSAGGSLAGSAGGGLAGSAGGSSAAKSWQPAALLEAAPAAAFQPQIAFDGAGNALAVWVQINDAATEFDVWASRYSVAASSWGTAVLLETRPGFAQSPQVAMNGAGDALAIWQQDDGPRDNIWANHYSAATKTWGTAALLETDDTDHARDARIAIDANGNGLAVWKQVVATPGTIWGNRYSATNGAWDAGGPTLIDTSGVAGTSVPPRIGMTTAGDAVAVWSVVNTAMARRYTAGSGWGATVETVGTGSGPEVGLDGAGNATVVFSNSGDIWANRFTVGTGWGTAALIQFTGTGGATDPQLAVATNGNAMVTWVLANRIWYTRYTVGTGWFGFPAIIQTAPGGGSTAVAEKARIAVDGNGNALSVWLQIDSSSDDTVDVYANRYSAETASWGTSANFGQVRINAPGASGHNAGAPQLAIDANGDGLAVWTQPEDSTNAESIWYSRYR